MEVTSSSKTTTDSQVSRKWKGRDHQQQTSPERTKVWTEPNKNNKTSASVIYYLSRNGQLEHPHFMDVPLSSTLGLYLKDVIHRLNLLRGKGIASMYSWSSKRSYKNGFVWHDLTENDFIHPIHGQEYVLKGSEIIDSSSLTAKHLETAASSSFRVTKSRDETLADFSVITRRRNQSWSSTDLNEYKVCTAEPKSESFQRLAADASTQTEDKIRRRKPVKVDEEEEEQKSQSQEPNVNQTTELTREEISPPPSDSSPETLESLMKADGKLILCSSSGTDNNDISNRTADHHPSGRMKASMVLMQLITCGSISFRDCGPGRVKEHGFSLIGHYKERLPRSPGDKNDGVAEREIRNLARVRLEDKEYFSGSLIETNNNKKEEVPSNLKRSNSYNADRSSQLQLLEEERDGDGVRAKCIPRKRKALPSNKESSSNSQQYGVSETLTFVNCK